MAKFDTVTKEFYCECGCGTVINFWSSWAPGHQMRLKKYADAMSENNKGNRNGCGEETDRKRSKTMLGYYTSGYLVPERGRVASPETCKKLSDRAQEFWDSPEGSKVKARFSDKFSGEGNPHWKGGYYGRYPYGWRILRDFIWARDNFTCQSCGSTDRIGVHHIDSDSYNDDFYNLITVCQDCNMGASRRDEEKYWFSFYTAKIKDIYKGE